MKTNLTKPNHLLVLICILGLSWQSCEPPPLPTCSYDTLFTTSASVTYNETNHSALLRVLPPQTCADEVFYALACNYAYLTFYIDLVDCDGNTAKLQKAVKFNNDDATSWGLDWSVDAAGGTILSGDQSVVFTLSAPTLSAQLAQVDISVYSIITDWQACGQTDGANYNFFLSSLNFYQLDGTFTPPSTLIFENLHFQDAQYLTFSDVIPSGC